MKSYLQKISVNRVFLHELKITFWVSCTKYVSAGMCREKWQIPDLLSPGNHNATLLYLQTWQNNVQPPRYGKWKLVKRLKFSSLCKCGKTLTTCHRPGQVASDSVAPSRTRAGPLAVGSAHRSEGTFPTGQVSVSGSWATRPVSSHREAGCREGTDCTRDSGCGRTPAPLYLQGTQQARCGWWARAADPNRGPHSWTSPIFVLSLGGRVSSSHRLQW